MDEFLDSNSSDETMKRMQSINVLRGYDRFWRMGGVSVFVAFVVGTVWAGFGPLSPSAVPYEREYIWPDGKMPDVQSHQIAAKTGEKKMPGFKADDLDRKSVV